MFFCCPLWRRIWRRHANAATARLWRGRWQPSRAPLRTGEARAPTDRRRPRRGRTGSVLVAGRTPVTVATVVGGARQRAGGNDRGGCGGGRGGGGSAGMGGRPPRAATVTAGRHAVASTWVGGHRWPSLARAARPGRTPPSGLAAGDGRAPGGVATRQHLLVTPTSRQGPDVTRTWAEGHGHSRCRPRHCSGRPHGPAVGGWRRAASAGCHRHPQARLVPAAAARRRRHPPLWSPHGPGTVPPPPAVTQACRRPAVHRPPPARSGRPPVGRRPTAGEGSG